MKIVVLDGNTLNPGDLSWEELEQLGACTVYERTPPELVLARARDAEVVLTNKVLLDANVLAQLPELRYIGVLATGYNVVDLQTANERGIIVTNVPAYGTASVAQMTIALLLELTSHVAEHSQSVHAGDWVASPDFSYTRTPLVELDGLTMGIVGFGQIGQAVTRLAQAFGMRVIVNVPRPRPAPPGITFVDMATLFRESDVVSLHCPLTPETKGLVNAKRLGMMKPSAFLLNTSRGPLLVEQDVADALNTSRIAGAGVDVLSQEPPHPDNPLLSARNCLITPHIAWATRASRQRLLETVAVNVSMFIAGTPKNVVK